jgi:hypothetical protein
MVLVSLIFVNVLNFNGSLSENNIDLYGFFVIGGCIILNVFTGIRLYYQIRYGEALDEQLQK